MLTPTSDVNPAEGIAPGDGRGGVGAGGAVPTRYAFTVRGWVALSPWNQSEFAYSILQLKLGSNFISKLEVVSMLNITSQAYNMYCYSANRTAKYNPKVYLGTSQTIARNWNLDSQYIEKYPEIWPEIKSQKGEANTTILIIY